MSAQEFEHGTGHKFSLKRTSAGEYRTCCGHTLESGKVRGLTGFSGKVWYTSADQHAYFGSLQQGKDWLAEEHDK